MGFLDELNQTVKDNASIYGEEGIHVMYKTGFDCFDYLNAEKVITNGKEVINPGLDYGKITTIIGKSGTGKTTLALQIAAQDMMKYEESSLFVIDFEKGTTKERIKQVTGMSEEYYQKHVHLLQTGISTNSVFKTIMGIKNLKMKHQKELMADNASGMIGEDGKVIKVLAPTFVIIDSIATMMPDDQMNLEEIQGQMSATAVAKVNAQLFKRIAMPCMTANINPIFINHISQKIETGPMPTQTDVNYLGQNEVLPGGKVAVYLSNTIIKIVTSTKLDEDKTYKIKGFETKISLVKSRTATAGKTITLIYNQLEGFDNDLSKLEFIKACGKLKGAGASFKLEGLEDHPFMLGKFKEKLEQDKVLRDYFDKLSDELLSASVRKSSKLEDAETELDSEALDEILED